MAIPTNGVPEKHSFSLLNTRRKVALTVVKVCKLCKEEKPLTEFYLFYSKWSNKNYTSCRCKSCHGKYKQNNVNTPKNRKTEKLKLRYGLTFEKWEEIRKQQNFSCMICGISEQENGRHLDVDHCHKSEKVRGVLCNHCNSLLGHSRDNIGTLKSAISYLEKYSKGYL